MTNICVFSKSISLVYILYHGEFYLIYFVIDESHVTTHRLQSMFGDSHEIDKKKIRNSGGYFLCIKLMQRIRLIT